MKSSKLKLTVITIISILCLSAVAVAQDRPDTDVTLKQTVTQPDEVRDLDEKELDRARDMTETADRAEPKAEESGEPAQRKAESKAEGSGEPEYELERTATESKPEPAATEPEPEPEPEPTATEPEPEPEPTATEPEPERVAENVQRAADFQARRRTVPEDGPSQPDPIDKVQGTTLDQAFSNLEKEYSALLKANEALRSVLAELQQ